MGELVMMFPTARTFHCTKTVKGQTLMKLDMLELQAGTMQPSAGSLAALGLEFADF